MSCIMRRAEDVQTLMSKVPRSLKHKSIALGCDANEQLAHCPGMQHVIGPYTLANSNSQRANSVLDIPLRYGLAACNTYSSESSVGDDIWTFTWKGDAGVHRQIDYIFASRSLVVDCFVDYSVDCGSDHKPVVAAIQEPIVSQGIYQHRSMKGWHPRDAKEATKFNEQMLDLPVGATSQEFQAMLGKAMSSVKLFYSCSNEEATQIARARKCLGGQTMLGEQQHT